MLKWIRGLLGFLDAEERRRELIIGYPWHYNRQARDLRSALEQGRIGRLEFVSCLFGSTVREPSVERVCNA